MSKEQWVLCSMIFSILLSAGCANRYHSDHVTIIAGVSDEIMLFLKRDGAIILEEGSGVVRIHDTPDLQNLLNCYLQLLNRRIEVIAENILHADTIEIANGKAKPVRRKIVKLNDDMRISVEIDLSDFRKEYNPINPYADEKGYVCYPNIDVVTEQHEMNNAKMERDVVIKIMKIFDPSIVSP